MPKDSCTEQPKTFNSDGADRQPYSVAVVEDDPSVRRSLQRLLSAYGFAVEAFPSAEAFLTGYPFAGMICAVLDIDLPGISGLELRDRLAAAGSKLPIIFMTALDDEVLEVAAIQSVSTAFLRKPFPAEKLIAAIQSALPGKTTD